jgi:hypothetical protein
METDNDLTGKLARLPDGQLVRIEVVHSDGQATVLRIEGEWREQVAVCAISKLEIDRNLSNRAKPKSDDIT